MGLNQSSQTKLNKSDQMNVLVEVNKATCNDLWGRMQELEEKAIQQEALDVKLEGSSCRSEKDP